MKITSCHDGRCADLYFGERSIRHVATAIERLRHDCGQSDDVVTSTAWFLAHAARSNMVPLVVMPSKAGTHRGALLLLGRKTLGVASGLFKAGYLCGRGAVIGVPNQRHEIVELCARLALRTPLAHTVMVTLNRSGDPVVCGADMQQHGLWRMRVTRTRLSLAGGMEGLLSRFTYKMRRNFRYYRQRAEIDLGCRFLPELSQAQVLAAVAALHDKGGRRHQVDFALRRATALRDLPGGFSAGLQDRSGNWISFLAGWRTPEATFLEWQLNDETANAGSLSMAMRHFWLEQEARLRTPQVVFVGETTPTWNRFCAPEVCGDLLATRGGAIGMAIREVAGRVRPTGRLKGLLSKPGTGFHAPPAEGAGDLSG